MFSATAIQPRHSSAWFLGVGLIDIVAGLFAVAWPGVTVLALALLFGIMVLIAGAVSLGTGLMIRRSGGDGIVPLAVGGVAVIAGLICVFHPGAGVFAIIVGCTLWFLFTGLGELALARVDSPMRTWFLILGVLSIVAAIVLIVNPGVAIATVGLIAGISFLIRGAGELSIGWRLRGHGV